MLRFAFRIHSHERKRPKAKRFTEEKILNSNLKAYRINGLALIPAHHLKKP